MAAQFVSDDDESQMLVSRIIGELIFQNCEGFDQTMKILVGANLARVENKRALELVALQNVFLFLEHVIRSESFVECVVHDGNLPFGSLKETDQVGFGRMGHREDVLGPFDNTLGSEI